MKVLQEVTVVLQKISCGILNGTQSKFQAVESYHHVTKNREVLTHTITQLRSSNPWQSKFSMMGGIEITKVHH